MSAATHKHTRTQHTIHNPRNTTDNAHTPLKLWPRTLSAAAHKHTHTSHNLQHNTRTRTHNTQIMTSHAVCSSTLTHTQNLWKAMFFGVPKFVWVHFRCILVVSLYFRVCFVVAARQKHTKWKAMFCGVPNFCWVHFRICVFFFFAVAGVPRSVLLWRKTENIWKLKTCLLNRSSRADTNMQHSSFP